MITTWEAVRAILKNVQPPGMITVSLERSVGHVLAVNILSEENIPSFDNSAMDGYALLAGDTNTLPVQLRVVDEIAAGSVSALHLHKGEAVRIMTGSMIPHGSNAVLQYELTRSLDPETIEINHPVRPGENIRKAGTDIAKGSTALTAGTRLRPQEIGILASLGKQFVTIFRPLTAALLVTGNELIDINKPLTEGKVRNSNGYVVKALLRQLGCDVIDLGIGRDDKVELRKKIAQGLCSDILITSGGVSVGKYDLVLEVMKELGVEQKFWKVNIKPGMPLMFGMYRGKPVFGLPGNPVSTFVTFLQFVKPAILQMQGENTLPPVTFYATLTDPIRKTDGKRYVLRGVLGEKDGNLHVHTTGLQTSNLLTSLSKANCLIVIPEEKADVHEGEKVEIQLL